MKTGLRKLLAVSLALLAGVMSSSAWALHPTEVAKLVASDGALDDEFGYSVSVDGDTAVIGAWRDNDNGFLSGSAYVFVRNGTTWSEQAKLLATDGVEEDFFGYSVAVDGDTAVIGAFQDDDNGDLSGSAYVFSRSGTTWSEQAKLLASDAQDFDSFGISVAVDGDTAVIGTSPVYPDAPAYVFVRNGTTWSEQAKLLASDGQDLNYFGHCVAVDGDTAVIGAYLDDDNGYRSGSAFVFVRNGTTWSKQVKLLASDGTRADQFGYSVAVDGDTAVIGAKNDDDNDYHSGSAYVFVRTVTTWSEQAKLLASDGAERDVFGYSVSVDGDTAVIGAIGNDDDIHGHDSGSAYVFVRSGTTWSEQAKLLASDGAARDYFGISVAVDGNTAVIGSVWDDDNGEMSGSAYVFALGLIQPITIDIKPDNPINTINPRSKGVITVAILTSEDFDALQVDPETARFGPAAAAKAHSQAHVEDVDDDGDMDLLFHFRTQETGIKCCDIEATLTGETWDGFPVSGTNSVHTVSCK